MVCEETFLLCPPRYFGVHYVINPWMDGNVGRARREVALQQWATFRTALAARAHVEAIAPVAGLPDMTFIANAGLVHGDIFIPSRFRFPQRQPEVRHFTEWFRRHGLRIVELPGQATFEGEGDALFQPGESLVWGGYGVRSTLQVYRHLTDILNVEVIPLRLVDERFYHLDMCLCALPGGRVVYYAEAFDRDSIAAITARIPARDRFAVSATDALNFACNGVNAGRAFITNFASDALRAQLAAWGYEVVVCPLTEFILAGGAAKCLTLRRAHPCTRPAHSEARPISGVRECVVEVHGHLLDRGLMNRILDCMSEVGGSFEIETFQPGLRHDQQSWARLRVAAPSAERLQAVVDRLVHAGARVAEAEADARWEPATQPGVAPPDFYSTTIYPTDVRVHGQWVRVEGQRMDAVLVIDDAPDAPRVRCRLLRELQVGDRVVCGSAGMRIHPSPLSRREDFGFMGADVSSERRVELLVERVATEMRALRARAGKIVVVAGPVVIHTGGGPHLAALVRRGYVQALLAGNGFAVHDIEQSLFGTSLGVNLKSGTGVPGGHQHHLRAINRIRAAGGIARAVEQGMLRSGVMHACVRGAIPFALAGSIRDDGPLPETFMDLIAAQDAYAHLLDGADMILLLASMLHAIGVGNMTPAGVRLICVDISPAVVTKLADRGSIESTGIVTDVGLFLNLLETNLGGDERVAEPATEDSRQWTHTAQP